MPVKDKRKHHSIDFFVLIGYLKMLKADNFGLTKTIQKCRFYFGYDWCLWLYPNALILIFSFVDTFGGK